jgi:alkaline phosphatase D
MLDTRIWGRNMQAVVDGGPSMDAMRTLLGADQERFLTEAVTTSTSRWKLLGQQVIMGQISLFYNPDQWDGYPQARQRFFDVLRGMNARDVVVLTGDVHASVAFELAQDPRDRAAYDPMTGRGSLAVELVVPAISSPGLPAPVAALVPEILRTSPHIKYAELTRRGYVVLDITPERVQGAYYHFEDITLRAPQTEAFATAFSVASGTSHLVQDMAAAAPLAMAPALAPGEP